MTKKRTGNKKTAGMFGIIFIAYFVVNFHRYAGGISAPILVEELALTPSQVGLFGAIFTYCYAFANFPAGILIDKFGSKRLIAILYLIAAVGTLMIGATQNFTIILLGRAFVAIGIAPVYAAASKVNAEWVAPEKFTVMNGWLQSFGRAGGVIAATPLVLIITAIGWRNTYYCLAVVSLVIAIAAYLLILDKDKTAEKQKNTQKSKLMKGFSVLVKQPQYWLTLVFMVSLNATTVNIFANWGGVLLTQGLGFDSAVSSNILLTGSIAAVLGGILSGYISAKKSAKFAGYIGQTLLLSACIILAFFTEQLTIPICYVTFFVIGLVEMYVIASGFSLLRTQVTAKFVGTAFGFGNLIIWICGSSLVSQLWGVFIPKDYALFGFKIPLMFHVVLVAAGLICLKFIKEKPITALVDEGNKRSE
ncbi:MFS transporter [Lacrimispora indolis]|nr:MFS transporter [[Clostridium] methoxybenzovorans]